MTRDEFNKYVRGSAKMLFALAYRILRNQDEAEDAVQEVFLRLWKMGDKLDEYKSIDALATTMTKNYCVDQIRKKKFLFEDISVINDKPSYRSTGEIIEDAESFIILQRIIDRLPDNYREMIKFRDIEGLSYEEIAEKTGQNINTIRVNMSRARTIVKNEYENTSMRKEEVDKLLDKYYQGISTTEEEQLLKDFFDNEEIPSGYEVEKSFFTNYSILSDTPEASADFEERIISAIDTIRSRDNKITKTKFILSGIAAGITILIGLLFFFSRNEQIDTFKDPDLAYAETVKILYEVSAMMNSGTEALEPISSMNLKIVQGLDLVTNTREILEKTLPDLKKITSQDDVSDSAFKE
ncbi:MAG TPA: sigma-70 family RNA polymerase sigma factor [Bacteroidales bacterium]|nr:sigma-70 family RNA polymerase sigma factor [Bacteroidales bacterium]